MSVSDTESECDVDHLVFSFLQNVKSLNKLSAQELDELMFKHRFDLLPPPKTGGEEAGATRMLPNFLHIPMQDELHDALVGGKLAGGIQGVAHVLYPEHVPWPLAEDSIDEDKEAASAATAAEAGGGAAVFSAVLRGLTWNVQIFLTQMTDVQGSVQWQRHPPPPWPNPIHRRVPVTMPALKGAPPA
mmetsp:Transcript_40393/g.86740  ORF Transcript_40393/g.86740 Transcript_40393/m.86740 type:complete len:187 (+) Transcript_40393:76-636(+)